MVDPTWKWQSGYIVYLYCWFHVEMSTSIQRGFIWLIRRGNVHVDSMWILIVDYTWKCPRGFNVVSDCWFQVECPRGLNVDLYGWFHVEMSTCIQRVFRLLIPRGYVHVDWTWIYMIDSTWKCPRGLNVNYDGWSNVGMSTWIHRVFILLISRGDVHVESTWI